MTIFESDLIAVILVFLGFFLVLSKSVKLSVSSGATGTNSYVRRSEQNNTSVEMSSTQQKLLGVVLLVIGIGMLALLEFGDVFFAFNL